MKDHFKKYWGWYALAVAALVVTLYFIFRPKPPVIPPNPNTPPPNLADNIAGILSGIFSSAWIKNLFGGGGGMGDPACQSANPGFDNNGYYTTKCGGVPGGGGANCDPANPGKDMNGFIASQCGG